MTGLDLVLLAGKKKIIQVNGPNLELKFCMSTQEMIEYLCSFTILSSKSASSRAYFMAIKEKTHNG